MGPYKGEFTTSDVVYFYFDSFDGATGASEAVSGLSVNSVKIYKNGSPTQRASVSGVVLLDTDGIDFDGLVGLNGFSINLADNSDAGFFHSGEYDVVLSGIYVDTQPVNFHAGSFSVLRNGGALDLLTEGIAEMAQGAPPATPTVQQALMYLYMAWRNQSLRTSGEYKVTNNAGTVICKAAISDDGTTFTKAEFVTGP